LKELKILSPNGQLGYGFPVESFEEGMRRSPDMVGVDAGSSDGGAAFLARGISLTDKKLVKRDLSIILPAILRKKIPLIIGSAGTAGGEPHLKLTLDILKEIAFEGGYNFRIAVIHSEIPKAFLKKKLSQGKIHSLSANIPELTEIDIEKSIRIVGQMGTLPFIKALDYNVEVILAGRACDTAIFSALPIKMGFNPALSAHMGKIMECGAYCSVPGSASDCIWACIRENDFVLDTLNPIRKCTPVSVVAHTLYEQMHPSIFYEPEGMVDSSEANFEQYSDSAVRVWGTKMIRAKDTRTIKLEGAILEGYRTICIAGLRDPYLMANLESLLEKVEKKVSNILEKELKQSYKLYFRVYGKDAVLGKLEPVSNKAHEVGIVIEAIADTQEIANTTCAVARSSLLHYPYPGRKTVGGNIAFPFSPSDIPVGPVYKFGIYHLLEVKNTLDLFPIEIVEV